MVGDVIVSWEEELRQLIGGLNQSELGRRAGVHPSIISRFVRGERSVTLKVADRLREAAEAMREAEREWWPI